MSIEEDLSGEKRAAIVLLSLNPENAALIMSIMEQSEILSLASAMSSLGSVESEVVESVLSKFVQEIQNKNRSINNSSKAIENILGSFLSKEEVGKILTKIQASVWRALEIVNPKALAEYLSTEHPQAAALILSKIKPSHTAAVLPFFSEEFAKAVMERVVNLKPVSNELLEQIEQCLKIELMSGVQHLDIQQDVAKQLALTLKSMPLIESNKYLYWLKEKHPQMAICVEDLMFSFEDLTQIGVSGLSLLIGLIDQGDLTLALRRISSGVQNFFFTNMPQRMVKMIQDEWDVMGKIKMKDIKEAQKRILVHAKELIAEGKISLQSEDEEYV
jgi:flagellar motor switch protein FliG